jgi:small-conductance mechanosensitive channel
MELMTNPIKTYSSEELIKLNTMIPINYDQNLNQAIQIIVDSVNSLDVVHDKDKTKAYVMNYGDSGVEIKAYFRVDPNC